MSSLALSVPSSDNQLHQSFAKILPRIERHARIQFSKEADADKRADLIEEAVALAWTWFRRLAERGKDATTFPMVLAEFAVRSVRCGRRVVGTETLFDVMNKRTQKKHGFTVESLPSIIHMPVEHLYAPRGQHQLDALEERLHDNTQTPVPDQAAFRCDFPAWLSTWSERDRRIIDDMAMGERTSDLSQKYGVSPARVSQLRQSYHDDWERFCDDWENVASQPVTGAA